jgi:cellulose synthase operon protein C
MIPCHGPMLKVECESCKAPYQIDERRVPPTGLKMRCPKCGHSFLVTNPNAAAAPAPVAPAAAPKIPVSFSAKRTMMGVAPPSMPAAPPGPPPAPLVPVAPFVPALLPPMRATLPSDFPAALGSLDESDLPVISASLPAVAASLPATRGSVPGGRLLAVKAPPSAPASEVSTGFGDAHLDLPVVASDLPTAKGGPRPAAPKAPSGRTPFDLDLPARLSDLPARLSDLPALKHGTDVDDLPVIAAGLPVPAAALPSPAAGLPSPAASLPSLAASLPATASALPVLARGFGEIDLPHVAQVLPSVMPTEHHLPARSLGPPSGAFGEIELPRERGATSSAPPVLPSANSSPDFGDLDFGDKPRPPRGSPVSVPRLEPPPDGGAVTFGEVDFGGGDGGHPAIVSIGLDASDARASHPQSEEGGTRAGVTAPVSTLLRQPMPPRERPPLERTKRSYRKPIAGALMILALLGGAALQLTSYGAFGYLLIGDAIHSRAYARATSAAMSDAERSMGLDTYEAAKRAVDGAFTAHIRTPRARTLTAYAALVDAATSARFGSDPARVSHVRQLMSELPPDATPKYLDVAVAAQAAADGDLDKARRGLTAASLSDTGDPIQLDVALLRGGVELAARDVGSATAAFKHAVELSGGDARGHFGLAQAYDLAGDPSGARKEVEATLALSPQHPGALTLRARMKGTPIDQTQALSDLAKVLDVPENAKASPDELSKAYAARAWIHLDRGAASEARDAFTQAVNLNPRNVEALNGEGRLLLSEGRFTEALTRFDTALQYDPASPETIANDAEAKIALERLADAKQQLLDARQHFPKNIALLLLLARVEQHLGNLEAAETDLRSAMSFVEPSLPDAVLPYVALAKLQASRGSLSDASTTLEDARKALPASPRLDRAFGEVSELQGEYDAAITDYESAIAKDPRDVATHFRLAVVLRRVRKFDAAGAELDRVAAVDKDYPGLSLERGVLFEESGDVEKAIEQFKSALAKAPDDPDLQLRVGSAYVAIGRPDDALPMLRKVLQKRPTSAEAHHYIGRALMLKSPGDQVEAIRYLKRAVDIDPNRAEFHVYLAWAANDAQPAQLELARDEIDKALALDKQNAEAYWQKGVLEHMEGAIEDAIHDERRALALRPSRYEAHATLAECLEDKNDDAGAAAEWLKAIAGDGTTVEPDGTVPHPFWRFRFAKLLAEHGKMGAALPLLLGASAAAEKMDLRPGWLGPLEFLTAEALRKSGGHKADAIEHYRRFLEVAPVSSPDRADAHAALAQLTGAH